MRREECRRGRLDEAMDLYNSLCEHGPLVLLPQQIDPGNGEFMGNYPQASAILV